MPTVPIDYSLASQALASPDQPDRPFFVSTPFGLSIVEIQGLLVLPSAPQTEADHAPDHAATFVKVNDVRDAFRIGRLLFDEKDSSKVVLFVGSSQRLNGAVETLHMPLAVLRVAPTSDGTEGNVNMVDIIHKKIIFKDRPLPIM